MRMRRLHRLLGVVLFVPALLWGLSGALLAWKNWDQDRAQPPQNLPETVARPFRIDLTRALLATGQPAQRTPRSVEWRHLAEAPYFVIQYDGLAQPLLVSGETGEPLRGVSPELARHIAASQVPASVRVTDCVLQEQPSLIYLGGMDLPVYRLPLSDGSEIYLSPTTGEIHFHVPRIAWAIRFAFYGLHVWQWSHGPGPHHSYLLLLGMALLLCASSVTGMWLWLAPFPSSSRLRANRDTAAP